MPIVISKSLNFLLAKFTLKAGRIYPQEINLPPLRIPALNLSKLLGVQPSNLARLIADTG